MGATRSPERLIRDVFEDVHWTHRAAPDTTEPVLHLNPREVLMLEWAAEGLTAPQMARRGGVTNDAMQGYWGRMLPHLHVRTRAAAVAKALRAGVIR